MAATTAETERTGSGEHLEPEARPWVRLLVVYWITSFIESYGVSQVFAFMLPYLKQMGVPEADIGPTIGILSSLTFILGLPLVPLWGVWADKYSRKVVIIRSAIVEAVVFGEIALSATPWQMAIGMLLVGFQLGNTGVMLAALRDVVPRHRLGTVIGLFGVSSPIGMAAGAIVGGFLIDGLGLPIQSVYWGAALLSVAVALLLALGSREVRPEVVPTGSVRSLATRAVMGVVTDRVTMRLFAAFATLYLARQMAQPFLPLLVERGNTGPGSMGLATAIALVTGIGPLAGALLAPVAGWAGDRIGFRPVLAVALVGGATALAAMPFAPGVLSLAAVAVAWAGFFGAVTAMVFGVLAIELPPERRSATLNLVYLPLYFSGIVGPTLGAGVLTFGLDAVYIVSAVLLAAGALLITVPLVRARRLAGPSA